MAAQTRVGETSSSLAAVVPWLPLLLRSQAQGCGWPPWQLSTLSPSCRHSSAVQSTSQSPQELSSVYLHSVELCVLPIQHPFKHEEWLLYIHTTFYIHTTLYSVDVWPFRAAHPFFPANQCKLMGWMSLSMKIGME